MVSAVIAVPVGRPSSYRNIGARLTLAQLDFQAGQSYDITSVLPPPSVTEAAQGAMAGSSTSERAKIARSMMLVDPYSYVDTPLNIECINVKMHW